MRYPKTVAHVRCDRCDDTHPLEGLPEGWITIRSEFTANIHAPEVAHDLCPDCAAALGGFLKGDFVPPIPDLIEQPYEALTFEDFIDAGAAWTRAPWECELIDGQHEYRWAKSAIDLKMVRHCKDCGLLWTSARKVGS